MDDFYELLGVSESASQDDLKQAYRKKVRKYHPDVNSDEGSRELFKLLNRAYEVLSDPAERKDYDRLGHVTYVRQRMDGYELSQVDDILGTDQSSRGRSSQSSPRADETSRSGAKSRASGSSRSGTRSQTSASKGSSVSSERTGTRGSANRASNHKSPPSSAGKQSTTAGTSTGKRTSKAGRESGSAVSRGTETGRGIGRDRSATDRTRTQSDGRRTNGTGSGLGDAIDASSVKQSSESGGRSSELFTLGRAWLSVALSFGIYLVGLGGYVSANRSDIDALVGAVAGSPAEGLLAPLGVEPPLEAAVIGTMATIGGEVSLVAGLLLGAVLLAATMAVTVKRFGSGSARLYAVAGVSPIAGLGAGLVTQTTLVLLLLLVVLPVGGCLLFLADVGRYLGARG